MKKILATFILLTPLWVGPREVSPVQTEIKQEMVDAGQMAQDFFLASGLWPEELDSKYSLSYTFDSKLQRYIAKLLKRYRSDFSTVVVIDNNTGMILASVGHQRGQKKIDPFLPFSVSHPSASLFKIVSAAALMEFSSLGPESRVRVSGRGTTLYRYQVLEDRRRWARDIKLKKAFAYSNNAVFGKAAVNHLSSKQLMDMARKFGYEQDLMPDIDLAQSKIFNAQDDYQRAELASGFNRETLMGPIHAAVLSSIVANDGVLRPPFILKEVSSGKGQSVQRVKARPLRAISTETSQKLKKMMELTVTQGTARGSFRRFFRGDRRKWSVGGKTGTISGGLPYGKRDWFTAFALPKESKEDKGISISVMNVNINKWYIRSALLARKIIEFYIKDRAIQGIGPSGVER